MKLYVIAGHGNGDPGASGNGTDEATEVRKLATKIKQYGGDEVGLHPFDDNAYASNAISKMNLPKDVQIVELHMDSYDGTARGGHVIINAKYNPDGYDEALAGMIGSMFPGRANKIVGWTNLANANRAAARGYGYRLVENGFIDNAHDLAVFRDNMGELAKGYLRCFGIEAGDPAPSPAPEPSPTPPGKGFQGGAYRCTVDSLNVRDAPNLGGKVVASYSKGQTVVLDSWYVVADGYVWARYIGAQSGKWRYVAVGKPTGKPEADDYLVLA